MKKLIDKEKPWEDLERILIIIAVALSSCLLAKHLVMI